MILQKEETPFKGIKTRSLKSRKIYIFPKGLTHCFGPKMAICQLFVLGNVRHEIVFYDIVERKNAFLGYKSKKSKKSKNLHYSKRVNPWVWSKNGYIMNFFFWSIQARKMSFMMSQNEKTPFQAIKTRSLKGRKIDIFPKWLTTFLVQT